MRRIATAAATIALCLIGAQEARSQADTWGPTQKPSRDTFTPAPEKEAPFDLSRSLLANPTLLEGVGRHGLPAGWSGSVNWKLDELSKLRIEKDETVPFQGKPSTRISFGPCEQRTWWQLLQNIEWSRTDLRGKKLRLTYYIYRDAPYKDTARDFILNARLPAKENYARPPAFSVVQVTNPGAWTRVVEGKVDNEADFFNFTIQNETKEDRFWISGFLLELVEQPFASYALNVRRTLRRASGP